MVGCSDVKRSKYASVGSQKTNPVHILFGDRIRNIDRKLESKKALFLNHVHVLASLDIYTLTITIRLTTKRVLDLRLTTDQTTELLTMMYWLR